MKVTDIPTEFENRDEVIIFLKGFATLIEKHCMTTRLSEFKLWRDGRDYRAIELEIRRDKLCRMQFIYVLRRTGTGSTEKWILDDKWGWSQLRFYPLAHVEVKS